MDAFVYRSTSYDPFLNMALENYLFQSIHEGQVVLFFYQNKNSVIIGRNQNPWQQACIKKMEEDKVFLCRRSSGGGAVYQDKGNLNFCFITKKGLPDKKENLQLILFVLEQFNIFAKTNDRHDLLVRDEKEDFKFSGSAFRNTLNRSLHHGTLLIDSHLEKLKYYLNPPKRQWQGHAVSSTPARVVNLKSLNSTINIDCLVDAFASCFFSRYKKKGHVDMIDGDPRKDELFKNYHNKIKSFQWCLGGGPPFTQILINKSPDSPLQCRLDTRGGIVERVQFSQKGSLFDKIAGKIAGRIYCPDEIECLLKRYLTF